ncbi:Hsp70 family protein, partial [Pirellulales bacterium]|nr:Hsp70 family protein [Pirellulales bacterium]
MKSTFDSNDPKPPRPPALGIDLGTTMSAVAFVDPSNQLATLRDEHDSRLTPSAIYIGDAVYVGAEAIRMEREAPGNFVD